MQFKSDFLNILQQRGFIYQVSDAENLDNLFKNKTVKAYIGFDPTASSLHVGSLLQIMMLYWLQATGHQPITLMGGATGLIGDPSFKDEARKLLDHDIITQNINGIKRVFGSYLNYESASNPAIMVNNADWLSGIHYLDFLREVGRHFSVNRMLSFDSVRLRLERESSLSFLEFNYMILQAYDFVKLYEEYGVELQLGGSDQWGNIINGIDLGHRLKQTQLYGLTSPLLTTSSGQKMGKTANGAVWLNADMVSPYEFWQYWRNVEDADVIRFLKLYTTLDLQEIDKLAQLKGNEINEAKKILATEVTGWLHGKDAALQAQNTASLVFEQNSLAENLPTIPLNAAEFVDGYGLLKLLVLAKLANSNAEARRQLKSSAIKLNDNVVQDETYKVTLADFKDNILKLSFGRKKHVLIKLEN